MSAQPDTTTRGPPDGGSALTPGDRAKIRVLRDAHRRGHNASRAYLELLGSLSHGEVEFCADARARRRAGEPVASIADDEGVWNSTIRTHVYGRCTCDHDVPEVDPDAV